MKTAALSLIFFVAISLLFVGTANAGSQCTALDLLNVKSLVTPLVARWQLPPVDTRCVNKGESVGLFLNGYQVTDIPMSQVANLSAISAAADALVMSGRGHYYGVSGEENDHTNTRHTDTPYITSDTAPDLQAEGYLDFTQFLPAGWSPDSVVNCRCNGPLTVLQCSEEECLAICGGIGWQHYIDLYAPPETHSLRDGIFFAFNRTVNGTLNSTTVKGLVLPKYDILWFWRWSNASTVGTRMVAAANPDLYDLATVNAWTRPSNSGCSFGPFAMTEDGWAILPDSCPSLLFETPEYFAGIPHPRFPELTGYEQVTGTIIEGILYTCEQVNCTGLDLISWPHITETRGVTKYNRQHLTPLAYLFKVKGPDRGQLKTAFIHADVGRGNRSMTRTPFDEHSRGFVQPYAGGRRPEIGRCDGMDFRVVIVPSSFMDTLNSDRWLYTDGDPIRIQAGVLSGNIPYRRNKFSVYKLYDNGTIVFWQSHYNTPEWRYKGQRDPYNASRIFASDWEAIEKNYEADGMWTHGTFLNKTDCTIVVGWSNGHSMPEEPTIAAALATAPPDEKGGRCLADQSWYQFMYDLAQEGYKTTEARERWGRNKYATAKCRHNAIKAMPTWEEYDQYYLGNSWAKYDLKTGQMIAANHHQPFDTFVAVTAQWASSTKDLIPRKIKFNLFSDGNDADNHAVVLLKDINRFAAFAKDGSYVTLNPHTLETDCYLQIGHPTSGGTTNYGMTTTKDGRYGFVALMLNNAFGPGFGNIMHNTTFNRTIGADGKYGNPLVENTDPFTDGLLTFPYHTAVGMDPGLPRVRFIDYRALVLAKVDNLACKLVGTVELSKAEQDPQSGEYIPFSVAMSSNGDLLCTAAGFDSSVKCFDMITMRLRFRVDLFEILNATTELPPFRTFIYINTAPIIVGNKLYVIATEGFFSGLTPGRFLIGFNINYPANYTVSRIPDDIQTGNGKIVDLPAPKILSYAESRAAVLRHLTRQLEFGN